jgi:hypothetical protein
VQQQTDVICEVFAVGLSAAAEEGGLGCARSGDCVALLLENTKGG